MGLGHEALESDQFDGGGGGRGMAMTVNGVDVLMPILSPVSCSAAVAFHKPSQIQSKQT